MNFSHYLSNAHTHTNLSDGHVSPMEMAETAYSLGFLSLGISDHAPVFYENSFQIKDIENYVPQIKKIKEAYHNKMEIICGIELDGDLNVAIPDGVDYVIGSTHTIHTPNGNLVRIEMGIDNFKNGVLEFYGGNYIKAIKDFFYQSYDTAVRKDVDIIGHFDLITKYNDKGGFFDENSKEYLSIAYDVIDGILSQKPHGVFELNTGCIPRAGKTSPYPSKKLLQRIYEKGGRIIVNSDAHRTKNINAEFDSAFELLEFIGFKTVWRLRSFGFEELNLKEKL